MHMSKKSSNFAAKFYKTMKKPIKWTTKVLIAAVVMWLALGAACVVMSSCNVTRVITNESSYVQRGDTSVVIHTKTIETYDASKKSTL